MENNFTHIVIGDSALGSLKCFFQDNKSNDYYGDIIGSIDDLSLGNVYNFQDNISKRVEFFCKLFRGTEFMDEDNEAYINSEFFNFYKNKLNIPKERKIVIWYGNNIAEELLLRYLVNRFKENTLYEVCVSKIVVRNFEGDDTMVRAVGECSPEELGLALKKIKLIDDERKNKLNEEWLNITKTKENLRVLKEGKILGVSEEYFDDMIIKYTTNEFISAARVIGETMGNLEELIGDTFLYYRVRKLIEEKKLEFEGKIGSLRELKVKLKV